MKHKTLPVLFLLVAASIAHGQLAMQPLTASISTNGSAEIHVKPDLADLSFEIEIRNVDLTVARKQQAAVITKLLGALRAAGIGEQDLQTSQVIIKPVWNERHLANIATVRFYSVTQTISCTLHDVDKVPDITTAALAAGVTDVSPAVFRTSDLRKYRDEARVQAIRAAKEKAVALASELGAKVGKPQTISEYQNYYWGNQLAGSNSMQNVSTAAPGGGGEEALATFAPGMITVTANIQVTFQLD
jgi:uncharacterized protein YggE